ncbi:Pears and lemons 1 [Hyphodiscus hymeniophilus]|uniref:Pears and lemons 1 n=1 Tax=Hyphodiscus hymeniophilus TaxID=353542 RepID=A0A9P7B019_9HELO|nr:Pears and lemons 1 [Hyphodiscus hymeniophilus]
MSIAQPEQDSRSPPLSLNLSSNNPFRNRAVSPSVPSGQNSPLDFPAPPRPVSRNPFLDNASTNDIPPPVGSLDKMSFATDAKAAPRSAMSGNAAELFDNLTLSDEPASSNGRRGPVRSNTGGMPPPYSTTVPRSENEPPRPPPGHRPTRSQEEAMRARRAAASSESKSRPTGELDIFADPSESPKKSDARRIRRNSESSIAERKLLSPEEEKKRQERKRRERKHREREGSTSKSKKPDRKLDIIDKLDVTSIYGTGSVFHHDGPFDACNPHRNRQGSRRAPMQAFPKDSLNNVLGGGGPLNKRPDHAAFLGNNDVEAFKDYSKGGVGFNAYEPYSNGAIRPVKAAPTVESATTKTEPIHGEETLGLGTSTFLEGAPASKTAIHRREVEQILPTEAGGLGRKKSLAQKIRGINTRRDYGPSGRLTSPDGIMVSPDAPAYTPGGSKITETNPFFNEFTKGDDKKESITIVEPERQPGRARAPSSPRRGFGERLERRVTSDGSSGVDAPSKSSGGGFLSRVKSLKGGPRKPRTDKPYPSPQILDS